MRLTVRNTHKYLSFFISLQLLLWTISGIYFAFNKIENVRGEQYRIKSLSNYSLKKVDFDIPDATSVDIKKRLDETIIVASTKMGMQYFDEQGGPLQKISDIEAKQIVKNNTLLKPIAVKEINSPKKGSEYRGSGASSEGLAHCKCTLERSGSISGHPGRDPQKSGPANRCCAKLCSARVFPAYHVAIEPTPTS